MQEYHTSSGLSYSNKDNLFKNNIIDFVKDDTKLSSLTHSALFKRLYKIINVCHEEIQVKQLKIEKEIFEFNKTAFEELLKTPKIFYKKGLNILINTINSIDTSFTLYKNDYTTNKKYWFFLFNTPNSIIISIVLSTVIPFIFKNNEFISLKLTSLYKNIGKKLIDSYFENEYYKYKT